MSSKRDSYPARSPARMQSGTPGKLQPSSSSSNVTLGKPSPTSSPTITLNWWLFTLYHLPLEPLLWKRVGNSRTGSSLKVGVEKSSNSSSSEPFPSLLLTWRGEEPLDRLHLSVRVASAARSLLLSSGAAQESLDMSEKYYGHCSIALEQLCKVAIANRATGNASISPARILVHRGRPMHHMDSATLQRELVTFCCKIELVESA
jgi:hypothetical protein